MYYHIYYHSIILYNGIQNKYKFHLSGELLHCTAMMILVDAVVFNSSASQKFFFYSGAKRMLNVVYFLLIGVYIFGCGGGEGGLTKPSRCWPTLESSG